MTISVPSSWIQDGPTSGPVLVLIDPLGSTLDTWDRVVPILARDHRVIRFDLRGHGRSPALPGPYEIADLGRDIVRVIDEAGADRVALVGISIGAMGAMWVACHAPERVDGLVLGCTSARLEPSDAWVARAQLVRRSGMGAVARAVAGRWVTPAWAAAHPNEMTGLTAMVAAVDPGAYAAWCDAIAGMDLRGELASIGAPTLVVAGAEDTAIPMADLRQLADGIAGARLVILPEAAHHPALEQPDALAALLLEHVARPRGGGHD